MSMHANKAPYPRTPAYMSAGATGADTPPAPGNERADAGLDHRRVVGETRQQDGKSRQQQDHHDLPHCEASEST